MVVSMIVIAALMVGVITTSAGLVREKESGTVEQLIMTPLRRHEIVIAKMAPPLTTGMIALGIFLKGVGWSVLWPQFVALAASGTALFAASLIRLKTRIYA